MAKTHYKILLFMKRRPVRDLLNAETTYPSELP